MKKLFTYRNFVLLMFAVCVALFILCSAFEDYHGNLVFLIFAIFFGAELMEARKESRLSSSE